LSISSIAAIKGYPIILTDKYDLSKQAEDMIKNINPSKVYIIGGNGVIDNYVNTRIKNLTNLDNSNIIRIWGNDRYETSLNVAKYFNLTSDTVTLACGDNFPDALAGSVLAANVNAPIILVNNDTLAQKKYIDSTNCTKEIIFGGTGVINNTEAYRLSK
jgi:putative cell wall-binding protein